MGLYVRSARSLLAYSFVLGSLSSLALSTSLLPRYLVQLFRRLKGPRYADMLFVTRESRHGCLRQAGRQADARRFPPQSRKLRTSRRRLPYLDFSTAIFPPFPVDFRRLFHLSACLLSREEQADLNRLENAPLDVATTREDWMRSRSIDAIYGGVKKRNSKIFKSARLNRVKRQFSLFENEQHFKFNSDGNNFVWNIIFFFFLYIWQK